eukprot:630954-Hanusia_phi.AAC.1
MSAKRVDDRAVKGGWRRGRGEGKGADSLGQACDCSSTSFPTTWRSTILGPSQDPSCFDSERGMMNVAFFINKIRLSDNNT